MLTSEKLQEMLKEAGYYADSDISFAAAATVNERTPLLIEGDPGCGKTSLAKAVAKALGLKLIRLQMYEGITAEKALYDYDYQKQLLSIEAIRSSLDKSLKSKTPDQALEAVKDIDFYGTQFLIRRPVLQAISPEGNSPSVLLIDEIDKASEELEYTLLETLDTFSMTIPQYGTLTCTGEQRPLIFLTSNNYRDLSDALKRRCNYLYIPAKTQEQIEEILAGKLNASEAFAKYAAQVLVQIQRLPLRQTPSISEGLTWAEYLLSHDNVDLAETTCMLAKTRDDTAAIRRVLELKQPFQEV